MSALDKVKNAAQDITGEIKEKVGHVLGNNDLEAEGKADQVEGNLKQAGENVKQAGENVKDALS